MCGQYAKGATLLDQRFVNPVTIRERERERLQVKKNFKKLDQGGEEGSYLFGNILS